MTNDEFSERGGGGKLSPWATVIFCCAG